MFFVSEEFLRKYQEEQEIPGSTLADATEPGASLFPEGEKKPPKAQRHS